MIDDSTTPRIRDKLDWPLIILEHIQNINRLVSLGGDYESAIYILEAELSPLMDNMYLEEKHRLSIQKQNLLFLQEQEEQGNSFRGLYTNNHAKRAQIERENAIKTLRNMIHLLNRKSLYLEKAKPEIMDHMSVIIQRIARKVKYQNQSETMVFVGPTGGGKSWSALSVGEQLAKNLKTNLYYVFSSDQFLKIIKDKPKPGTIIVFDEAGAGISSREFWKDEQIKLMKVFQTMRYMNLIVILTVPNLEFIDKIARSLIHTIVNCISIDRKTSHVVTKIYSRQVNAVKGSKPYDKTPRDNSGTKIDPFYIPKPSPKLVTEYESAKDVYLQNMYKSKDDSKKEIKKLSNQDIVTDILDNDKTYHWIVNKKNQISIPRIEIKYKVGGRRSQQIKEMLLLHIHK